ncbi:MAG: hypothetical protein ABW252_11950 [Polyangiales bacterium]
MLTLGACADVDADALENEDLAGEESDDLAQLFPRADAGTATTAETDGAAEPVADQGVGDGKDVIMMGDSWMSLLGNGLQDAIKRKGKRYREYGVPGVKMLSGLGAIPGQFDTAVRADRDIKTVIMTGGGNDVLLGGAERADCPRGGPTCQKLIVNIRAELVKLWEKMAAAGVKDVLYVGYSESAGKTSATPQVTNTMTNGTGEACLAMKSLRCTPLDSTPIVGSSLADGIHPTRGAHDKLADAVLKLMEQKGMRR